MNIDLGNVIKGFFKFIYVFFYSFFKGITVDFYNNFKTKWSGKGKSYRRVKTPAGVDYSKPEPDYKEISADEPAKDEGLPPESANVFDIFK